MEGREWLKVDHPSSFNCLVLGWVHLQVDLFLAWS